MSDDVIDADESDAHESDEVESDEVADADADTDAPVAAVDDSDEDDDEDDDDEDVTASRNVLEYLVKSLVDDADAVDVEVDLRGRRPSLNVTVGDGDMGRIIGRRGHIAQSIRRVTRAAAAKDGTEINIEFID